MKIFIIKKCVNMKRIIERVVSQTIKEYINENFSRPSILKENDGDANASNAMQMQANVCK